ncbi:E3 ubiquitin-protein ligase DTX3L isoform X1 [Embiotoca jacksoni]|uniref:E3 ubiquitin-protein ligase DTX3L isoform X1 n=1 Tax=Embiotoca jacksoni TaxID=100190 RepID=UPI0037040311
MMTPSFLVQLISDITLLLHEGCYDDPEALKKILHSYCSDKKGSCYRVRGTLEQLENLVRTLPSAQCRSGPDIQTRQQEPQAPSPVPSVDVSGPVMSYIEQKQAQKLEKIVGKSFIIESDLRSGPSSASSTVKVTFRMRHAAHRRHADAIRHRFITFYQRTASDLQLISLRLRPQDRLDLQQIFPQVLFTPGNTDDVSVIGPFTHIAKLKEVVSQKVTTSRTRDPADNRIRTSATSLLRGPAEDTCPICMETITRTQKTTLSCKHSFCRDCLKQAFAYKPVCPTCGRLYGVLTGTQPAGGTMTVSTKSSSLPGYEKYGTIIIHYYIPGGVQQEEHPNPGQPYEGVSRTAYLPNSSEGRRTEDLLRRAFNQRLIFTIGRSTTSGRNNTVTWNDIHHKTSTHGGSSRYGYPDPEYLNRVKEELKVKGIH